MIQELPKLDKYYHPIPFEEYQPMTPFRQDCAQRYSVIKESYGNFNGLSMFDFGCAEGYFMFKFIQDGGKFAVGIEQQQNKVDFINRLADAKGMNIFSTVTPITMNHFDIGLYLDLYGHSSELPKLQYFYDLCDTLYISPSGHGVDKELPMLEELKMYSEVTPLGRFLENRMLYRCSK